MIFACNRTLCVCSIALLNCNVCGDTTNVVIVACSVCGTDRAGKFRGEQIKIGIEYIVLKRCKGKSDVVKVAFFLKKDT